MTRARQLHRVLGGTQMSLIVMGGAIGTGLFLGSGFAIGLAGPSVLISFAIGAVIALLLMGCLAEMTVMHPESGGFSDFAARYIGPLAGVLVSYAYLSANLLAVGTEGTAIALGMRFWFPGIPGWWWIAGSGVGLILVNLATVRAFGWVESGFSAVKIAAILLFIGLGTLFVARAPAGAGIGLSNYRDFGGIFPHGLSGMWMAVVVALFSYVSVEMIAITAAEARDPRRSVIKAMRLTSIRLTLFYLGTIALILAIAPWTRVGTSVSPFVTVMAAAGLPAAAAWLNIVVLVAALSAMNSQIYAASRMIFGLATAGFAPAWMGAVNERGVPVRGLLLASAGMMLATVIYAAEPDAALGIMIALSVFGALFTWLVIFASHLGFRAKNAASVLDLRLPGYPVTTWTGLLLVGAAMVTTVFMPAFRLTLVCGVPFLALVAGIQMWTARQAKGAG